MSVTIYTNDDHELEISVTHFAGDETPWCSINVKDEDERICIYMSDEHLRELTTKIDNALRVVEPTCDVSDCDNAPTCKVTVDKGQNIGYFTKNLCTDCALTNVVVARGDADTVRIEVEPVAS